jgi:hypothetical protein
MRDMADELFRALRSGSRAPAGPLTGRTAFNTRALVLTKGPWARFFLPPAMRSLPSSEPPVFHGLPLPEGVEKRVLYHSTYRAIVTYAMSLSDLDRELRHLINANGCTVKEDGRRNLQGKRALAAAAKLPAASSFDDPRGSLCAVDIVTSSNELIHALTDTAGNTAFVQLKFWKDF